MKSLGGPVCKTPEGSRSLAVRPGSVAAGSRFGAWAAPTRAETWEYGSPETQILCPCEKGIVFKKTAVSGGFFPLACLHSPLRSGFSPPLAPPLLPQMGSPTWLKQQGQKQRGRPRGRAGSA